MNYRPRILLLYVNSVFAAECSRHFRRRGWDVHMSVVGDHALALINALAPTAVVLDAGLLSHDAAHLTSKINVAHPGLTVVSSAKSAADSDERVDRLAERLLQTASAHAF